MINQTTILKNIESAKRLASMISTSKIELYKTLELVQEHFNRTGFVPKHDHEYKLAEKLKELGFEID